MNSGFMESLNKPIIVPWDFTQIAKNAYDHAVNLALLLKREIVLLHIVHDASEIESSLEKLKEKSSELGNESKIMTYPVVKAGSIFGTISAIANEYKAEMVVMGTHGRTGMQKFFGSHALKVIVNSKIPFLVIQDKPASNKFEKIIFPIDFRSENKEQVKYINYLSSNFQSKFLLFKRKADDKRFKQRIASNLHFVEGYLHNNNVNYELYSATGSKPFEKEVVDFAHDMKTDLILALTTRDITFFDYLMGAREQYLIANPEKIPVLCINPKPAKLSSGFRATGG
jgi:nucleotide-binding universal stress UspA family protein